MRALLAAFYAVLLMVGVLVILYRNGSIGPEFVAHQGMPANWRLQPGDVVVDNAVGAIASVGGADAAKFTGRYLRGRVQQGEVIRTSDVDAVPTLVTESGSLSIAATLPRDLATAINAERCVHLTGQDAGVFKVKATLCPAAAAADCAAILAVPTAQAAALVQVKTPPKIDKEAACQQ